jgi:hypothetical protein
LREIRKYVTALMNPVKKREYAANVFITTEREENSLHVIFLQMLRLLMTEA